MLWEIIQTRHVTFKQRRLEGEINRVSIRVTRKGVEFTHRLDEGDSDLSHRHLIVLDDNIAYHCRKRDNDIRLNKIRFVI